MYFFKGFNECVPRPTGRGRGPRRGAIRTTDDILATGSPDTGADRVPNRHLKCCHDIPDVLSDRGCKRPAT